MGAGKESLGPDIWQELKAARSMFLVLAGVWFCAVEPHIGAVMAVAGLTLTHHDAKLLEKGKL